MKTPSLFLLAITLSGAAWVTLPDCAPHPPSIAVIEDVPLPAIHTSAVRKNQTPPHEPTPAAATDNPTPLEQALSAADVCETARIINQLGSLAPIFGAFLKSTSPSAEVKESYGAEGAFLSPTPATKIYKSLAAQTLQALTLAGELNSPVNAPTDLVAARALLQGMEKKEPANAFFPLFRVLVETKLGYSKEKIKSTAALVSAASSFDSHVGEINREMHEAAFENPALLYAQNYLNTQDMVSYYTALRVVAQLEGFDKAALARLMTEEGLHSSSPPWLGEFEQSRYSAGRSLDPERYPTINALNKDRALVDHLRYAPHVNTYGPEVCDPGPFERYFWEARDSR
jgi:hypothetical protein